MTEEQKNDKIARDARNASRLPAQQTSAEGRSATREELIAAGEEVRAKNIQRLVDLERAALARQSK